MMRLQKVFWLLAILLLGVKQGHSQDAAMKVIYKKDRLLPGWTASTTEGATLGDSKTGIAFTIDVWQEGKDLWPRMWLLGPGIDLSAYTRLIAEIENPTDNTQNIVIAARETAADNAGQAYLLPPRSTTEIFLDISDGALLNQSNVKEIPLYLYHPTIRNQYVLKKLTAVRNPDFVSKKTALGNQLAEAERAFGLLKKATDKGASQSATAKIADLGNLLASAQAEYKAAVPGYASGVQEKLLRVQEGIARAGMDSRGSEMWLWTSPLGHAIRKGTLPSPADPAVQKISERICLNQYKAIPFNISAAAKAKKVRLKIAGPAGSKSMFSLRPTLFVTARDASETADAIDEAAAQVDVTVEPYQSQQVLIWVNTKDRALRAGKYEARLTVSVDGAAPSNFIPVSIDVADIRLSDQTPLNVHNWAYFYIGNTPHTTGLENEAVANLRDYGINTWSQDYTQIPLPKLTADGKYDGLDPAAVEHYSKILELQKGSSAEAQIIWLGFQRAHVKELLAKPGVLQPYLRDMSALLDKYKVPKDKRYIQFWDEPRLPEVRESIEWMRKIRAIDPTFKFYDNSSFPPPDDAELKEFAGLVDRWLPNWDNLWSAKPEDNKRAQKAGAKGLGFYRCLVSRNNRGVNIYEYYRLMGWYLMPRGWDTLAFWVYNVGPEVWDGTQGSVSGGTVVFKKDGKLFSSRRWELFREGLEDYKLAQAAVGTQGVIDAKRYPELLKICNDIEKNVQDAGYADRMRLKLIDLAVKRNKTKAAP